MKLPESEDPMSLEANLEAMLPELALFCRVAVAGGFNGAAMTLDASASTLSRNVARLERALNVRLFERNSRFLSLTSDGKALFEVSRPLLRDLVSALRETKERTGTRAGTIRISCAAAFGRRHIAPHVVKFQGENPDIAIDLKLEDRLVDPIEESIDLCVRGGRIHDSRMIARPIAPIPLYTCASPHYLERFGQPVSPNGLAKHQCIQFRFKHSHRRLAWEFRLDGALTSIDVPGNLVLDDIDAVCDAAIAGSGLAQLPGYIAVPQIRAGRLRPVLGRFVDTSRLFYLHYLRRTAAQPLRTRLLINYLSEKIESGNFQLSDTELASHCNHT
jgi:DNA-binding transcriptional LysR family regulator